MNGRRGQVGGMGRVSVMLACLAAPAGALAQDSAPQLYGRLNLAIEQVGADGARQARLSNNRSVFGVRGSERLAEDLSVVYQIEGTVAPDTGTGAVAARDTRIGLQGRWGTLFGGNWSTPYNSATSALDPFYPTTAGYMSILGNGSASNSSHLEDTASFDRRQKNSLHYWSPAVRGWTVRAAHGFAEDVPASGPRPSLDSAALLFDSPGLTLALAAERHHHYSGAGLDDTGRKLAVAMPLGATRVALVAEQLRYADSQLRRRATYLSVTHQLGAHGLRFGIARAGDGRGPEGMRRGVILAGPDTGALHATLGYDHQLSKRTSAYAYYTRLRNDARGVAGFAINGVAAAPGATLSGLAVGLRHGF